MIKAFSFILMQHKLLAKWHFTLEDYPGISFLSCSAHKFHGPKGTGVAFIRQDEYGISTPLTPLIHGGGQEQESEVVH